MVIPEQMKQSVAEEEANFLTHRRLVSPASGLDRLQRYDYVAQYADRPRRRTVLCESKHIGGSVLIAISPVQTPHILIIAQEQADFHAVVDSFGGTDLLCDPFKHIAPDDSLAYGLVFDSYNSAHDS
jgi:hypothetical protein